MEKPKRKGFLGIFGKKKEVTPAVSTTILHSVNRNVISEQKVQDRQLSEQADSLAARQGIAHRGQPAGQSPGSGTESPSPD